MVPCLAKVEKYKKIYERLERFKDNCYNLSQKEYIEKRELGFRFYRLDGVDDVVVFERMFFVYDIFVDHPFISGKTLATVSPEDYESFQSQASKVLSYIREGFIFQKNHPDFNRIEKLMLEVKVEKEKANI